jgi:hypothetical protein
MKKVLRILGVAASLLMVVGGANAQATRTWVSGVGDDANPCSRTAPCKTFAGAISKTASGGIINAIDPGGFGSVTITKPLTIDGAESHSSVLASGTSGIIINISNPGPNDVVVLRNLHIDGITSGAISTGTGIRYLSAAAVLVDRVHVQNFTIGIDMGSNSDLRMDVRNSSIVNNTTGIRNGSSGSIASLSALSLIRNGTGVLAAAGSTTLGQSSVTLNQIGLNRTTGLLYTFDDNQIFGNGSDTQGGRLIRRRDQ